MAAEDPAAPLSADLGAKLLAVHRRLDELEVSHAFGGAIALAYHVRRPRGTVDLDVNLSVEPGEAGPILVGLAGIAPSDDDDLRRVQADGFVRLWMAGRVPLDLFFPQHRFHADLQAGAPWVSFRGVDVQIVSASHLAVLKAMFDRSKDWVDIESMLEAGTVDVGSVQGWLAELLGADHPTCDRFADLAANRGGTDPG